MKTTLKSFGLATAVSVLALPALASEKVSIGVPSWTGAQAIAHVLGEVVTSRIGGEVEYVPGNNATIFQAMDQGRGDIDVHPDVWLPNQESFTNKYVDEAGTVTLSSNPYQGNQGFCVTQDFAAAHDITDIADLGRPDVAALMDSDGNGRGEMWIGAPGWASANVNEVKVRDYGLLDFIEPIRAEEAVKTARIKDSIAKGEGYAFYCYEPHAVWFMFDVTMLTEPTFDPAKYVMVQPSDDADWYEKSMVATKDALKDVQIAWSNSLVDRSPAIAEFFANFQLNAEDVSQLAYQISAQGRDPAEVAAEWVNANSDRVDGWLGL
ncbi:substrate-binding region of ABC-type glycine betaine transport system [Dinoroseobacter shibae DFL 12 = DSM 16493]|jgi:glycine betaine/proline transport system substrate-binding protein|uniref:Substrate-binding region of ABC-type glycine betaine transport system n=1 Tax=Dinoroseobacter shibae (strain DSM 16493 / NCIMB 14021 / DFL 12) TaxID=398580 RepID=A8LJF8_DINSH|nr:MULTISPECIES: glycine betaine ABC transporter substrate-binding protein [Dinoroseobacter]ABV93180.1 substrate-binding region of ABC-type glycine betaine transport system [Dinoroseobacter shibae DFL 12 = DSM 16493]MDD9715727.1 glycine betaine ABC transporter substrate-binding protein [Dinoroseobacter sp. PD6]URF48106.1 glycine/betaine ABC transporter substrate-binding protein [Dinoroseobacter shibae]URF52416.1 glycine/betaine ABC transporter substrate-binding protein [Dinoroseobacter shibae]